jgi:ssDNA-binding Zn-finger/Zn-ribbon topoisomerase 1
MDNRSEADRASDMKAYGPCAVCGAALMIKPGQHIMFELVCPEGHDQGPGYNSGQADF